jgi:hypothetical protein
MRRCFHINANGIFAVGCINFFKWFYSATDIQQFIPETMFFKTITDELQPQRVIDDSAKISEIHGENV